MVKSLKNLFDLGCSQLKHVPNAALEAKILLLAAAGIREEIFFAHPEMDVSSEWEKHFMNFLKQRKQGVPIAYITGRKEFWSMPFQVSPGVLIPRPETEVLVESAITVMTGLSPKILDIGTGSGNIAVALAHAFPKACIFASDISFSALKQAQANASALNAGNVYFFQGDLFDPVQPAEAAGLFDLVVSNPPYLSHADWASVDPGIREFEPREALVSGPAGLEILSEIIAQAKDYLRPGGHLCLEAGMGQAETAAALFDTRWRNIHIRLDLAGIQRVITAELQ